MRIRCSFAAILLLTQPAQACHRFARWYYPFPQRCSVARFQQPVVDRSWYVEIQLPSPKDELNRQLEQLKHNEDGK